MTEQPPGPFPGAYPPPPPPGGYPPPPPGNYPPPPPGQGYTPQALSGYVEIPGVGQVQLATIGQRMLARAIDYVIYLAVYGILWVTFFVIASSSLSEHTVTDEYGSSHTESSGLGAFGGFLVIVLFFAGIAFLLCYEWFMVATRGATLGKMAAGIRVVDQSTGRNLGLGAAFVRQIIPAVGHCLCLVGALLVYLSVLLDDSGRSQGWHDRAAHDLVIKPH